jgi:uncharacterized protein (DUF58 family)
MVTSSDLLSPDVLRQLNALSVVTRRSVQGLRQGSHRSTRRGHGVEFAEYRQYELGDNPRYIDWNLYARSDKIYIKRYLEEENVSLFIVIDGSRSITHPDLREKWAWAKTLATFVAYIGLSSQDPVTLAVLGLGSSPTLWGGRAFHRTASFLSNIESRLDEDLPQPLLIPEAKRAASKMKFPGICVFISDFLYPVHQVAEILGVFRARNMEVHAVQVLGQQDINPAAETPGATLADSETGGELSVSLDTSSRAEYGSLLANHSQSVRAHCLSHQVQFSSHTVAEPITTSCLEALQHMALFV